MLPQVGARSIVRKGLGVIVHSLDGLLSQSDNRAVFVDPPSLAVPDGPFAAACM